MPGWITQKCRIGCPQDIWLTPNTDCMTSVVIAIMICSCAQIPSPLNTNLVMVFLAHVEE